MTSPDKKVTIKDIAREAGVSSALVSFVMCNKSRGKRAYRVKEETARHILEIAAAMNYQPNLSARALKNGRTDTIGVIVSDISNSFFAEVAREMENDAYQKGYTVLFGSTDEDPDKLRKIIEVFVDRGVDGLVIVPCQHSEGIIRQVIKAGIPVVFFDREIEGIDIPSVTLNNRQASFDMTSRLIAKGYHYIEMISYDLEISNIKAREQGLIDAMVSSGLGDCYRIHRISHRENKALVDGIVSDARARGVEAFLFATNTIAVRGMSAMFRGGFNIPQDFGIASFDYNSSFEIYDTELIFSRQPVEGFSSRTMECIFDCIGHKDRMTASNGVVLEAEIIDTQDLFTKK